MERQDNYDDKYRDALTKVKEKSEDNFEKNITYISAGGLALSLTLIDKIVDIEVSSFKLILILSWIFFTMSLLVNLMSHYISSYYHDLVINELDEKDPDVFKNIDKRNSMMRKINVINVFILILGIMLLVTFSSINIF